MKVITVRDTPSYGHAATYQISLTYLERQKCYGPDKKLLFYVMVQTRNYYLKNNYLTFKSNVKVPSRSLWYKTHCLMVMHPHTKYHWPISKETIIWPWGQRSRSNKGHYGMWQTALWSCTHIPNIFDLSRKTKNGMPRTRKYYLKNNYLTFRSKVMVTRRSLRYTTNRLMLMHPHIKYHWPISKDKQVMVRTSFAEKQKRKKKIRLKQYISPFVRRGDIIKIHL
jgi:hypothetical protein